MVAQCAGRRYQRLDSISSDKCRAEDCRGRQGGGFVRSMPPWDSGFRLGVNGRQRGRNEAATDVARGLEAVLVWCDDGWGALE